MKRSQKQLPSKANLKTFLQLICSIFRSIYFRLCTKVFFGLCMCHFSALLNPIFYITPNVSYRKLCHVSLLCTFPTLVLSIPAQYVQLFHQQHHILDGLNLSSLDHFSYFLFRGPGFVLLQSCFQFLYLNGYSSTSSMIFSSSFSP